MNMINEVEHLITERKGQEKVLMQTFYEKRFWDEQSNEMCM